MKNLKASCSESVGHRCTRRWADAGLFKVNQTEESHFPSPQKLFKLLNAAVCVSQLVLFVAAPLYRHESLANMWPFFTFISQKVIIIFLDDGLQDSSNLYVSHLWNTILTIYSALIACHSDDTSECAERIWWTAVLAIPLTAEITYCVFITWWWNLTLRYIQPFQGSNVYRNCSIEIFQLLKVNSVFRAAANLHSFELAYPHCSLMQGFDCFTLIRFILSGMHIRSVSVPPHSPGLNMIWTTACLRINIYRQKWVLFLSVGCCVC